MSERTGYRGGHRARYFAALAAFAAGLAAAFAGTRLLLPLPPTTPAPEPPTSAATKLPGHAAPVASDGAVPPTSLAITHLASVIDRNLALYRLAAGLDAAGVERLLAEAGTLDRANERNPATWILYARYVDLDPEAALRHALTRDAERWLHAVFEVWAHTDLAAALRHAEALTARQRSIAGAAILQARGDLPREARAEIALRLAPQGDLQGVLARRDLANDPVRAWRQALAWEPGQARTNALHRVVNRWARTDPRTALAGIGSADAVDAHTRYQLRQSVVLQWAQADPIAVLDWLTAQPAFQARDDLINRALQVWADAAPGAVAAWLNMPEHQAMAGGWLGWLAEKYAARHPEEALDWLLTRLWDTGHGFSEMVVTFRALAKNDPDHAIRLLQRVGDADARYHAIRGLVGGWARTDPKAAMAWLDRQAGVEPYRNADFNSELLQEWAWVDGASATRHLDRLTEQPMRDYTIAGMIATVLYYDTALAETLFDRIESEDARRMAARSLYDHLSTTDPERAERYR